MEEIIIEKLKEIEQAQNVRILYAVESGSRAWGFASPDSDYDVRFIYMRQIEDYLKLDCDRDVIEWQLDEVLDMNGWDLKKALHLLHESNPTLFEWSNSPIVYHTTPAWNRIAEVFPKYFLSKPGIYHYLNMAKGNYREYLKGEFVPLKKYLYVLRPILACKWVLSYGTPPPMRFVDLIKSQLEPEIQPAVEHLLGIKMNHPQMKELNSYIEKTLSELEESAKLTPGEKRQNYEELNMIFINTLKGDGD